MQRTLVSLSAGLLLLTAVVWSGQKPARPELDFRTEKRNPVTNLKLNNDPTDFQFAIVSDRTGGHRAGVFSRAVDRLNLLQPEFVVTVGDLIEGYTTDRAQIARDWREFQSYVARLQMPFFYVPGNHDLANPTLDAVWKEKFGRGYYEVVYRNTLFLALNSEDPPGVDPGSISATQLAWLQRTLAENKDVRWTLVFLHKPMWLTANTATNGWAAVEALLAGRPHTVFAGHVHVYAKFTRNGGNHYYTLGTTGGISKMRGPEYGEVDHLVWVTLKKSGPVLANVLLDGVLREDLSPIASDEEGYTLHNTRRPYPVKAVVTYKGQPVHGGYVVFQGVGKEPGQARADGLTVNGVAPLSTYKANDGVPPGEYAVTVEQRKPRYTPDGKAGPNLLPAKFASAAATPLRVTVKAGAVNHFTFDLQD